MLFLKKPLCMGDLLPICKIFIEMPESPNNSIRHKFQKICSWSKRPKTMLEIRKKIKFLLMINNSIIYKFFKDFTNHKKNSIICKFFKDFTNHKKKTNMALVFSCRPFPNILQYRDHRWDYSTIWKTRLLQAHIEEFS